MKKIFLISLICYFYTDASMSLYRLKIYFDHLVLFNPQIKDLDQLDNYRYVCAKALQKIENNEKVADHVWYRLELARVIYKMGFEQFKREVEPYLCDWSVVSLIKVASCKERFYYYSHKQRDNGLYGFSGYFVNFLLTFKMNNKSNIFDLRLTTAPGYQSSLWNKNDYSKELLKSPQNGLLFFDDTYYGLIDFDFQKAFLYDFFNNNRKVDFSDQVPWNDLKRYSLWKTCLALHNGYMILLWDVIDQGVEGCTYYKINKELDFSSQESYKNHIYVANKLDISMLQKYSHEWFSWYAVEFFCRRPFFKYFHRLLPEHKYLYIGLSSLIVGKITMLLGCAAGVFFFCVARCFFLHKVAVCFSLLTSLLIVSFILRGHWMYVVNMPKSD